MTARLTGSAITRLRNYWAPLIAAGQVRCWACDLTIEPDQPWDLGHPHDLALGGAARGMVPEHRHRRHCPAGGNRSRGAHLGNQLRRARRSRRRLAEWMR